MAEKQIILIVDDTPENLRVLGDMLEENGYEVLVASSGPQALEIAKVSRPDIVLLDILMPDMDGYAVCRGFKGDPALQGIPIIFLSVLDMPEQKIQAFREGAVDYITKPFQSEEVVARVQTHLQLTRIEALQREVEERRRVEEALQDQTEELSAIYEDAPLVMTIVDEACRVHKINQPVTTYTPLAIAEIIGRPLGEVFNCVHAADQACGTAPFCQACTIRCSVRDTFETGVSQQQVVGSLQLMQKGIQQKLFYLLSTKRLQFRKQPMVLLCLLDISEQQRMQEQILHQQKLESIGTLAGGIAHDFNNILNAITGYSDLALLRNEDEKDAVREDLGQIRKAANRATDLVRQILTFSRKHYQDMQPVQVSLIVKEALKLLRSSIPTTIDIRPEISTEASVLADPTQIHQMVMNLCTNAFHAMMDRGGLLRVGLQEIAIDQTLIESGIELPPGHYVVLSVTDTGCGMDGAIMDKIFEPYFTTKEKDKGTGLGLAVVHGIVKSHHGRIAVYSEPGHGTTFNIYLPMIAKAAAPQAGNAVPAPMATRQARIMVVDDESAIRTVIGQFLLKAGYEVEVFANGDEAYQALVKQPQGWDLLITDKTMPGMTGEQLAGKALQLLPDLPVLLCSGYKTMNWNGNNDKRVTFLQKPVDRLTLLTQVAKSLG